MNSMRKPGKTVKGFSRFFRYLDNGFSLPLSVMKFLYSYQNIKWLSSEKGRYCQVYFANSSLTK